MTSRFETRTAPRERAIERDIERAIEDARLYIGGGRTITDAARCEESPR